MRRLVSSTLNPTSRCAILLDAENNPRWVLNGTLGLWVCYLEKQVQIETRLAFASGWKSQKNQSIKKALAPLAFELVECRNPIKSSEAADLGLVMHGGYLVSSMDLLVIVTEDAHMLPLFRFAHKHKVQVIGFGSRDTALFGAVQHICCAFEDMDSRVSSAVTSEQPRASRANPPESESDPAKSAALELVRRRLDKLLPVDGSPIDISTLNNLQGSRRFEPRKLGYRTFTDLLVATGMVELYDIYAVRVTPAEISESPELSATSSPELTGSSQPARRKTQPKPHSTSICPANPGPLSQSGEVRQKHQLVLSFGKRK